LCTIICVCKFVNIHYMIFGGGGGGDDDDDLNLKTRAYMGE